MGIFDKARHQGQSVAGKAKEATGRARGDTPQANAGKRDQKLSHLKKAGEQVKHVFKR
jgi:uncharacterized protein YjbJ (UPF0337 family)